MEINMNDSQIIELVTQITRDLVEKIVNDASVRAKIVDREGKEVIWVNIESREDPNLLIGQKGSNLAALQHLIRLIVRHKMENPVNFIIDVNDYKESRIEYLRKVALSSARQVGKNKKPLILGPMSPFERRIVHLALADNEEVETESTGEEGERRVIVKPKE